jgi:hypothetical protein
MEVPFFDRRDLPFGSRHRFDCYDHPQGISEVTLIPYQHLDGQCGAVQGYNTDLRFWLFKWEEGCPYCGKILLSYNLFRQHVPY